VERQLEGVRPDEAVRIIGSARNDIEELLEPLEDIHGSVEYKSYIVPVLLARTLERAIA
jgi:CO/xanthine dehydrogenase FAD-binding subunit